MLPNNVIQAAVIARLKSFPSLIALVGTDIKEDDWQGTDYTYPCLRVYLRQQVPILADDCNLVQVNVSVYGLSDRKSSKEADALVGEVNNLLHTHPFSQSVVNVISIRSDGLIPSFRMDERTWRSEASFILMISG